jgi:hypothetical protein
MPLAEMKEYASFIAEGGMFKEWNTPAKVMTLMMLAQAEGIHPFAACERYDYFQGKVTKKSIIIASDFISAGGTIDWITEKGDDKKQVGRFTAPNGVVLEHEYNWQMVVRAGNHTKDNYRKYPQDMMRARCQAQAIKMIYPKACGVVPIMEEVADGITLPTPKQEEPTKPMFTPAEQVEAPVEVVAEVVPEVASETPQTPSIDTVRTMLSDLDEDKLTAFLRKINWLDGEQGVSDLTDKQVGKVGKRWDKFKAQVEGGVK